VSDLSRLTDKAFEQLLTLARPSGPSPSVSPARRSLRQTVALLSAFPASVVLGDRPTPAERSAVAGFLLQDCMRVVTARGDRWSLADPVRRDSLRELDRAGRLRPFRGVTDPTDPACRMALRYLSGDAPVLDAQSAEELAGTEIAAGWLTGTSVVVPSSEQVSGRLSIVTMLEPLRQLCADGFFGRQQELTALSDYAELLPISRRMVGQNREVSPVRSLAERPPLLIYGLGGTGKSTLVAKFVLDHVDAGVAYRFPFAYLSFDRSDLLPDHPLTLLAEAATQLAAFFPDIGAQASGLAGAAHAVIASSVADQRGRRSTKGTWTVQADRVGSDEDVLVERFAALVESAVSTREVPNVWVLDTFEVAQRQADPVLYRLWDFLARLQRAYPRLRVILCGRAPIRDLRTLMLELGELDETSALQMLTDQLAELHLPEDFLIRVTRAIPRQPVSLRLAVLLLRDEAAGERLVTGEQREAFMRQLLGSQIQGLLYRRILDHVADPDVRRFAGAALALRRVTWEVVQHVLAEPCGLGPVDPSRAKDLFDAFRAEAGLVDPDGVDGVRARLDVRRLALPMLERDVPGLLTDVRTAAVEYYAGLSSPQAREEELYYRLVLGQSTEELDASFDLAAASLFGSWLDEFPASSQVYLASRLGLTVSPEVLDLADDLSWARQAALTARALLDSGRPEQALAAVRSRSTDATRPFTAALEVEALAALHRFDDALATAAADAQWCTGRGERATLISLSLLAARVAEDSGDFTLAQAWLDEVDTLASGPEHRIERLTARVAMVRLHRRRGDSDDRDVRAWVIREARELTAGERARNPGLVRDLAAEIGQEVPEIAQEALRLAVVTPPRLGGDDDAVALTSVEAGEVFGEHLLANSQDEAISEVTRKSRDSSDGLAF